MLVLKAPKGVSIHHPDWGCWLIPAVPSRPPLRRRLSRGGYEGGRRHPGPVGGSVRIPKRAVTGEDLGWVEWVPKGGGRGWVGCGGLIASLILLFALVSDVERSSSPGHHPKIEGLKGARSAKGVSELQNPRTRAPGLTSPEHRKGICTIGTTIDPISGLEKVCSGVGNADRPGPNQKPVWDWQV